MQLSICLTLSLFSPTFVHKYESIKHNIFLWDKGDNLL